jgi:hypothetical protein
MNYSALYSSLVLKAQSEQRVKYQGVYYESHHIVPKSFGGSDKSFNRVLFTPREHYVAHLLLWKMYEGEQKRKMAFALSLFRKKDNTSGKHFTARTYALAQIAASQAMTGARIALGHKQSDEHKRKRLSALVGNKNGLGFKHSDEARKKISEAQKSRSREHMYKSGRIVDPSGKVHEFFGVKKFSQENGLNAVLLGHVINGKRHHHNGWTRYTESTDAVRDIQLQPVS